MAIKEIKALSGNLNPKFLNRKDTQRLRWVP
jgi:hypothetical protein